MIDPKNVEYGQTKVKHILYSDRDFSIALLSFYGNEVYGMRWNGSEAEESLGTPTAHGKPTWFIVPDKVIDCSLNINIK